MAAHASRNIEQVLLRESGEQGWVVESIQTLLVAFTFGLAVGVADSLAAKSPRAKRRRARRPSSV